MAKHIEFWFDLGSPAAYLAWKRLPKFVQATGASVAHKPMLLGGVFKATGNASPVTIPAKGKWLLEDLARAARKDGVPLAYGPGFPINTLAADARRDRPADAQARSASRPTWTRCSTPCSAQPQRHARRESHRRGPDRGRVRAGGDHGARGGSRGEAGAHQEHRGSGRARRVRRADLLRRRARCSGARTAWTRSPRRSRPA